MIALNRRRTMGASKQENYIQDGLVFWLDGIERGTNDSTKWIDIIGGDEYVTDSGDAATWGVNHLITPCYLKKTYTSSLNWQNSTFEIVYQENDGNINTILYRGKDVSAGFGVYGYNYLLTNNADRLTIPKSQAPFGTTPYCFSFNGDRDVLVNGVVITRKGAVDYYSNSTNYMQVAYRGNGGKLYCIRKYNRKLTIEEMLHNQKVDNIRFNLGLNI